MKQDIAAPKRHRLSVRPVLKFTDVKYPSNHRCSSSQINIGTHGLRNFALDSKRFGQLKVVGLCAFLTAQRLMLIRLYLTLNIYTICLINKHFHNAKLTKINALNCFSNTSCFKYLFQ